MSLVVKVKRIQKVFDRLEYEVTQFQNRTGMRCLPTCGQCCTKPDIEASVLEFLPFAFQLYLEKKTDSFKNQLVQVNTSSICALFKFSSSALLHNYISGQCTQYQHRGLICRLFGFASVKDKYGQKRLSTCKLIKATFPDEINRVSTTDEIEKMPNFSEYYTQLIQIDFKLAKEFHPINKAILRAIEEVEKYYAYRKFPYRIRKSQLRKVRP
jgi:Fe-S-cluster containining protein